MKFISARQGGIPFPHPVEMEYRFWHKFRNVPSNDIAQSCFS